MNSTYKIKNLSSCSALSSVFIELEINYNKIKEQNSAFDMCKLRKMKYI